MNLPHTSAVRVLPASQLEPFEIEQAILEHSHVVGFNSRDIRSRPFNLLRSQLSKRMVSNNWKLIGLTSATPAAGKSFVSLNLAAAMSRLTDRSVYLFDFDLRRGSIAESLGFEVEQGIGEFLSGEIDNLDMVGRRVGDSNLAVFPCRPLRSSSAELLVGDRLALLIAAMRALPDNAIVLCDLPPVFANDDTMMVMQSLDAFLLIVEQGVTTSKQTKSTLDLLRPTPCAGAVLNRYSGSFADPYGYGYGGDGYSKYYGSS